MGDLLLFLVFVLFNRTVCSRFLVWILTGVTTFQFLGGNERRKERNLGRAQSSTSNAIPTFECFSTQIGPLPSSCQWVEYVCVPLMEEVLV